LVDLSNNIAQQLFHLFLSYSSAVIVMLSN
jgi:hypothetical protein